MSLVSEGVKIRGPLVAGVGEPSLATVGDYIALMKPRVMSLVVFTALVGLAVAPGSLHPVAAFTALLCIAVGAGAAGALNMWYDADVDALMTRTARRPVPMGRVRPGEALAFGLTLGSFAVVVLGLLVNWVASALLAFTIFFYVVDLYDLAQAFDAAEHRHRRSRRRLPANDRLGGGDRLAGVRAGPVCSSSSSSGRRRISGRWRFTAPKTTPAPASRCCPWSPATPARGVRSCSIP